MRVLRIVRPFVLTATTTAAAPPKPRIEIAEVTLGNGKTKKSRQGMSGKVRAAKGEDKSAA
jgi:hypothetical protein